MGSSFDILLVFNFEVSFSEIDEAGSFKNERDHFVRLISLILAQRMGQLPAS